MIFCRSGRGRIAGATTEDHGRPFAFNCRDGGRHGDSAGREGQMLTAVDHGRAKSAG